MGSLSASGTPLVQSTNTVRFAHQSRFLYKSDTALDTTTTVASSGTIRTNPYPTGVLFHPNKAGWAAPDTSGIPLARREIAAPSGEFDKHSVAVGVLTHDVTRAMGIHTSVSHRGASGTLGPNVTLTERKVFFLDSDRVVTETSGTFSDWTVFTATGEDVNTATGTTDVDVAPTGIFGI